MTKAKDNVLWIPIDQIRKGDVGIYLDTEDETAYFYVTSIRKTTKEERNGRLRPIGYGIGGNYWSHYARWIDVRIDKNHNIRSAASYEGPLASDYSVNVIRLLRETDEDPYEHTMIALSLV